MANLKEIKGKTMLITGGAAGIGAGYAEVLLKEGAKSIAILDKDETTGRATTARLNSAFGDKVTFIRCDVSKEEDIQRSFDEVLAKFGTLDVLINNAGIMNDAPNIWRLASDVNWQGVVSFTLKAVAHMRKDEGGQGGTIVNVSSIVGIMKVHVLPIYCGSKAAVLHFSQTLAEKPFFERTGIRVLVIGFGPTATSLMAGVEHKTYEPKLGRDYLEGEHVPSQKVESAIAAFITMFKEGNNGSFWMSVDDKPVRDLTPAVQKSYDDYIKAIYS